MTTKRYDKDAIVALLDRQQQVGAALSDLNGGGSLIIPKNAAYQLGKDLFGYHDPMGGVIEGTAVEKECRVDFVVSTSKQDRDGDVLIPLGCLLDNYRLSPLWFWNHQSGPNGLPIATAEDPTTKQLSVKITEDRITASAWFDQGSQFAMELYRLITHPYRLIRATSVGFTPLEIDRIKPEHSPQNSPFNGYLIRKWSLDEVSVCGVGSNPGALAIELGKSCYSSLTRKCLAPYAAKAQGFLKGATLAELMGAKKVESQLSGDVRRWNKSLGEAFDVSAEVLPPSRLEYEWVSRYLACPIKKLYQSSDNIPSPWLGSFLTGLKHVLASHDLEEVRNLDGSAESPPVYDLVQLNSHQRDDFLVEGSAFYRGPQCKFVVVLRPNWSGLRMTVYTDTVNRDFNKGVLDSAWVWAKENNFLKGEAFALSGEFLNRTAETWDDVFLEENNKSVLQRVLNLMNAKGKAFANRGIILCGPAGTGKTLSGRIIRNQAKSTFLWVSSRDFHNSGSFGGIALGFDMAKELAPSVLFIEDVDNWLGETTIDLIKTEMDGIARSSGVLTILTTNFPERLPAALIDRPGRFHDVLQFGLPTADARKAMLTKWLADLPTTALDAATAQTDGYSGAHVYELAAFARTLQEHDGMDGPGALREALKKVAEQKELINAIQLEGSNYRPRRSLQGKPTPRPTKNVSALSKLLEHKAMPGTITAPDPAAVDTTQENTEQGTDVQAVFVPKGGAFPDVAAATGWVEAHGYDSANVQEGENGWGFVQFPEEELLPDTARQSDLEDGVIAIVGQRRSEAPETTEQQPTAAETLRRTYLSAVLKRNQFMSVKATEGMGEGVGPEGGDVVPAEEAKSFGPYASHLKHIKEASDAALPAFEHPDYQKSCQKILDCAGKEAKKHFPDHDLGYGEQTKDDEPDGEEPEEMEKRKNLLAGLKYQLSKRARDVSVLVTENLGILVTANNLTAAQKKLCKDAQAGIKEILSKLTVQEVLPAMPSVFKPELLAEVSSAWAETKKEWQHALGKVD